MEIKENQLLTAEFVGTTQETLTLEEPTLVSTSGQDRTLQTLTMFTERDSWEQSDGETERLFQEEKMEKLSFQILQTERLRKQLMLASL